MYRNDFGVGAALGDGDHVAAGAGEGIANPTAVFFNAGLSRGNYTADILGADGMSTTEFADIICAQLG